MKIRKLFADPIKEEAWLNKMGKDHWRLTNVTTFGKYTFEPSEQEQEYEMVYLSNGKSLQSIVLGIQDETIHFVLPKNSWAYFRKEKDDKPIRVFQKRESKKENLRNFSKSYDGLGGCYAVLASSQLLLATTVNSAFFGSAFILFICSILFFTMASGAKKYASQIYIK